MAEGSKPPHGYEDANEDDPLRETEVFEDTLVVNSPFTEMEFANHNLETEIVEDSEPAEDMTTGTMCEYGQVVLDSEDEEMDDRDVGKGFVQDETSPAVKIPLTLLQKRQLNPPCERVDPHAPTFGISAAGDKGALVVADSFDDNDHLYLPAMLNNAHSPEPGDSTTAALGFVDQYLSSNDVDLFQEIHCRKTTTREKSPRVLSARGPLNLAKKIKARTQNEEEEPFKWVDDSCQNDNKACTFDKEIEASSNFGRYKQVYTRRRHKKGGHLQSQGNCNTCNRCDEKLDQGSRVATENNNSLKELDVRSSAVRENVNVCSSVTHVEDMFDIGLDTQIAAEAMDALAFMPPSGCLFNDTHPPENALDGSLTNLTENKAHLKNSSCNQNPGLHSIIKSKKNASFSRFNKITSSPSCNTDKLEQNPVSWKMKKMMKSKSTTEGQVENNATFPICSKHISREEVCSLGDSMSFQSATEEPKIWNNERRQTRIKDQPCHHTERNNNIKEKGIIRHKRKMNGLVADPVKLGVRTKHLKLLTNSCTVTRKSMLNHQAQVIPQLHATSSFSWTDSWVYPKRLRGKRKRANVNAPAVLCIDGKENNFFFTKCVEDQANVDKSCFPLTHPLCNASRVVDGRCLLQGNFVKPDSTGHAMKIENLHDTHPLLQAHVEISSNVAQSRSVPATVAARKDIKVLNANHTSYTKHHQKPCHKTLPKSSLLRDLTRLGIPESTSDMMWKDLRHRRDMTDVRVLFSQHLDDSIIKQQKKILARFNISVASSSMEATHFIADKFTRTKNMLETMALGKLVVNHLWLESCGQANCFIDEKNYILRDLKKEKEIGFSMPVSLARARQKPLLKGKRVYITPHVKPDKGVIASLVTAVHGQVVDESQAHADMNDLLILSSEDDDAICHRFLKRGIAVYSSELLLNGIVIQKLELERHQLFMNQATRRFGKVYKRR